jgi:bacillithiol biosynthesis cysteine-adding enzyme BshC
MPLRIVATPLTPVQDFPAPREHGFARDLAAAAVDPLTPGPSPLDRLAQPGAVAVTTGQQPGLFTGPLYTIYKALSAAACARVLERQWQRPVIPVFWIAGDDHDFVEASRASWIGADGILRHGELHARPADAPLTPMYREYFGPEIEQLLDQLLKDLEGSEFLGSTAEWLRRYYRPGATVAGSFGGALADLLAPLGVVCLESTQSAVKRDASDLLIRALELAPELNRQLALRSEELRSMGQDAGIAVDEQATLVMLEGRLGRDRLLLDDGGFITRRSRERFTLDALRQLAFTEPERLSPNVLLRPVVESALLPTVGYLGGPGELKYLPLARPVYELMSVPRQAVLPRWSGILVEPRVDRVLKKFEIELTDLLQPQGTLEARLIRSQLPESADRALAVLREALTSGYAEVGRSAQEIDPTLVRPVESTKNQALSGLQDIERKLVHHLKRRQETELAQLAKARASVLPENEPQERVLTIASFLARHGPSLITELSEAMEAWYSAALEGALHPS